MNKEFTIVGAGLAGSLLAILLARQGHRVHVFERRADPRKAGYDQGRSINLALAERGLQGLREAGLAQEILAQAIMMRGRMVHGVDGQTHFLRYGKDDSEVIWSVHRGRLNLALLQAAERAGTELHFGQRLIGADFDEQTLTLYDEAAHAERTVTASTVIGADGAGSALRAAMNIAAPLGERMEPLGHGYKELEIPPGENGDFRLEANALHIWPRGGYMCIALPNVERTFTVTLFLPTSGSPGFDTIVDPGNLQRFFQADFPDAMRLIPDLARDFFGHPTGSLTTLYLERWHIEGKALLIGDAAHAIVPFHGQGMNCAFEDCAALAELAGARADMADAFAEFHAARKPNADAIAQMAVENYVEMRDLVDDADFLFKKKIERKLAADFPDRFMPRYAMVTFSRIPYAVAKSRGAIQWEIVEQLAASVSDPETIDRTLAERLVLEKLPKLT